MALVLTVGLAVALPSQAQEAKGKSVFVRMDTTLGPIVLELYPDKAPQTVRNFLKYALSGFYEGTIFHRVDPNFMIQGGGFDKSLIKKVGSFAPVENEAGNGLKNTEYSIA
ncbi:MAG: peptidylprolyl isomerase, partial [Proteobacteria bacterium]|nr:peptidylprolyl isomerase [Pseudomonadota bacterium]